MKAIGLRVTGMAMVSGRINEMINIQVSGIMVEHLVMEYLYGEIKINMKEIGSIA
jgi:hypothetical protein